MSLNGTNLPFNAEAPSRLQAHFSWPASDPFPDPLVSRAQVWRSPGDAHRQKHRLVNTLDLIGPKNAQVLLRTNTHPLLRVVKSGLRNQVVINIMLFW
jgi:hypothetical protein